MKILHIIDTLSMGGAENLLIGLAGEQLRLGHDVTVMPLVCPIHTTVRDKMEGKGIRVMPIKGKGTVYNPFFIFRIVRELKDYDIVHVHLFPALYWAGIARMLSYVKVPLVYTEHSTNNKRRNNKILHATDRFVYSICYKMIVACSEKAKETFCACYPTIKNVSAINNGVDTKTFQEAIPYTKNELLGVPEDTFLVTMVARFMPMKRQDTIVEAMAKLPSNMHAVFVGGEETDAGVVRVKELVNQYGLSNRVHFLYTRNDVPRILKTSDVVLMASDYEGLSLSSIEGMAAGKPFVATNVNGLREVVGGAGLLFENKDVEELINILLRLSKDKSFYEDISNKCLKRSDEFGVEKMTNAYLKLYTTLC